MRIVSPNAKATFAIAADATWPTIKFATDAVGVQHTWGWKIAWRSYSRSGSTTTADCTWDATSTVTDLGGEFTVSATAKPAGKTSTEQATVAGSIIGTNPNGMLVNAYLVSKFNASGFGAILKQESNYRISTGKTSRSSLSTTGTACASSQHRFRAMIRCGIGSATSTAGSRSSPRNIRRPSLICRSPAAVTLPINSSARPCAAGTAAPIRVRLKSG